jgi:hypothetical protein
MRATSQQISKLFHAGKLDRQDACKLVEKANWRTVDELFPLLKYGAATIAEATPLSPARPPRRGGFLLLTVTVGTAVVAITYLLARQNSLPKERPQVERRVVAATKEVQALSAPTPALAVPPTAGTSAPATRRPAAQPSDLTPRQAQFNARVASYNAAMELGRRNQQTNAEERAKAERNRIELEKRRAEDKRRAGTDFVIPLGKNVPMDVGGSSVSVKIRDNNILTFDVTVNGSQRRNVRKEKGISRTGADETLIYSDGRASLYYVWELSGKLNHCLLRVREH